MAVAVPLDTLRRLSKLEDPDEFRTEVHRMMGNQMPEMFLNRILCAVYIENEHYRSATGTGLSTLVKAPDAIKEDIWQGKPCLVLAVGPAAFVDDTQTSFYEQSVKPGDWVTFKVSNSTQIEINKVPCRIIEDRFIEAKYSDPRQVTS
jgi:hypothetical protein